MRAAFAASVAALSVTGYITGAGDRHTENFLLHRASGALVPIDFGCAAALLSLQSCGSLGRERLVSATHLLIPSFHPCSRRAGEA